jgi:thioredoxin 1
MITMLSGVAASARLMAARRPVLLPQRALAVKTLTDESQYKPAIAADSLCVVYFTAAWCGPCKMISPIFEQLSDEYPAASFLKVDVDDQPDVAAAAQVAAMPTFQFFKSGKLLDKIVGADAVKLKTCVKNHSA